MDVLPDDVHALVWRWYFTIAVLPQLLEGVIDVEYNVVSGLSPAIENDPEPCRFMLFGGRTLMALEETCQYYHYALPYFDTIQMTFPTKRAVAHAWETRPASNPGMALEAASPRRRVRREILCRVYL